MYADYIITIDGQQYIARVMPTSEGSTVTIYDSTGKYRGMYAPGPDLTGTADDLERGVRAELAATKA